MLHTRFTALLLAVVLALSLTGCTGGDSPAQEQGPVSQSSSGAEESVPEPESASEPVTQPEEPVSEPASAPAEPASTPAESASEPAEPVEPVHYNGEEVLELWALDVATHSTVPYTPGDPGQPTAAELESALATATDTTAGDLGFILFTGSGRQYIYLGEEPEGPLRDAWIDIYNSRPAKNIHWVTHMTQSKLTSVEGEGPGGLHRDEPITDRATLDAIAAWLKRNLTVDVSDGITVLDGPNNPDMPSSLVFLQLHFDTGVHYTFITYDEYDYRPDPEGGWMSVYTSDLDQTISYKLTPGTAAALRAFFNVISGRTADEFTGARFDPATGYPV